MSEYADQLRNKGLQFQGKPPVKPKVTTSGENKVVEVLREDTGEHAGEHVFHPDGRVDAVITPKPI